MSLLRVAVLAALIPLAACSKQETPGKADTKASKPVEQPAQLLGPIPMEYEEPVVGGAKMAAGNSILANLRSSKDHTILVSAVEAAGLDEVLQGGDPVTFFAPTNGAFERMPGGYRTLLQPEQRDKLVRLLTYHLVPGRLDSEAMASRVMQGNGTASIETVEGSKLTATVGNGAALLVDGKGTTARISVPNVLHSNGVVYVVENVLSP